MVVALGAVSAIAVQQRQGRIFVSPPPALAAAAMARCPDFTLEDNGVCLPLARPAGAGKVPPTIDWVSAENMLSALHIPWRDAPVPQQLTTKAPTDFQVLLVRTRVGSEVRCATSLPDPIVAHIGKAPDNTWVLTLAGKSDAARTISIASLASLAPSISAGSPCANGTPLGTSGDALVVWEGSK